MADTIVDFLLEDLKEILSCSDYFNLEGKEAISSVYEDLKFISNFLKDPDLLANASYTEFQDLMAHMRDSACTVFDLMDSSALLAISKKKESRARSSLLDSSAHLERKKVRIFYPSHSRMLVNFKEEVSSIKKELMGIGSNKLKSSESSSSQSDASHVEMSSPSLYNEEVVVGFEHEEMAIKEWLVGEQKQLQVISVVGMAGIGKTTLAKKLYSDPLITYHFYVRGWTCVSQVYRKKDVLLSILSTVVPKEDIYSIIEEKLGEYLCRRLKGRRYLIVVDDIWNTEAWEDLRKYFPNDNNGSRILLTTRLKKVALQSQIRKAEVPPHYMSLLNQEESWNLLQQKVFEHGDSCPSELVELGRRIAAKCQGLPLALVVVGGLLSKTEKKKEWWEEVSESVGSYITSNAEQHFLDIVGLSYDHLPHHLKSCFLYFAAFPEDYKIPVWWLVILWIAEGFVVEMGEKSLQCMAEEYLVDLVGRNLVIACERRSRRGVKACRLHDMLWYFCLRKAEEIKLKSRKHIDWYPRNACPPTPIFAEQLCFHSHNFHALSGNPCFRHVYSKFSYVPSLANSARFQQTTSHIYKLVRVLNLMSVYLDTFPHEVLKLYHLRFLEIHVHNLDSLPKEISNLWNLEALIIDKGEWGKVTMPHSFWNMVKLRHLLISDAIELEKPHANQGYPPTLESLQSISSLPVTQSGKELKFILKRIPNLRKLVLYRGRKERKRIFFPNLTNMVQLDTLKLTDNNWGQPSLNIPPPTSFPQSLKKITLSGGHADWKEVAKLGKLPNLEVLKLRRNSFSGPSWETSDGHFLRLKFLKLTFMDLQQWITSSTHFPSLEHLIIERCLSLKIIPSCLGDVATLQMIKVSWSSHSASNSALSIQKEQHNNGNDVLRVTVSNPIGEDEGIGVLRAFSEDEGFQIL